MQAAISDEHYETTTRDVAGGSRPSSGQAAVAALRFDDKRGRPVKHGGRGLRVAARMSGIGLAGAPVSMRLTMIPAAFDLLCPCRTA
jgi:hypothetical protein